ncbi:CAP domain-containing protein [Cladorrhinum sp. PSN259]|nr:CAP domain-containing protein [Cladorrhinum sp. PSN259]
MKSSAVLATCGALLAAASPILDKRRLIVDTKVVVQWVTVTVTEGDQVTAAFIRPAQQTRASTRRVVTTTSVAPPPPPPPPVASTSTTPEVVVQPTPAPAPQPVTTVAPAPKPVTTVAPAPRPVTTVAPVVEVPAPVAEVKTPAAAPAPAKVEAAQPSDYASTAIFHHNKHRFNHSAGALDWDQDLAGSASVLAARCKFAHDTQIGGGGYGQNIAMFAASSGAEAFGASNSVAKAITGGWYNNELEIFDVNDYGKDSPNMLKFDKWGHYTQVVWKDSQRLGCASQLCPPGTVNAFESFFTVCNYAPAGNMGGAYGKNVFPPLGQPFMSGP